MNEGEKFSLEWDINNLKKQLGIVTTAILIVGFLIVYFMFKISTEDGYFSFIAVIITVIVYRFKTKNKINSLCDELSAINSSELVEKFETEKTLTKQIIQNIVAESRDLAIDIMEENYNNIDTSVDEGTKIDENQFNEIKDITVSILNLIKDSCNQDEFIALLKRASHTNGTINDYWFNLKSMLIKDILRSFSEMGYAKKVSSATSQGQCLYFITRLINDEEDNYQYSYDDFKNDMKFDALRQKFINNVNRQVEIYSDVNNSATSTVGHDDFNLIMAFALYKDEITEYLRMLLFRLNQLIAKSDGNISAKEKTWLKQILKNQELLEELYTDDDGNPIPKQAKKEWIAKAEQNIDALKQTRKKVSKKESIPNTENLKSSIDELNELIGLSETKKEITTLSNYIQMKLKRDEMGMKSPNLSLHCVFTGNPGTGKTTVARILAGIYKDMGLLKKGHLVETDRSGLIAEYVGQTAVKTNKKIDEALDGVLFIDEAYSLVQGAKEDYGPEAISTLLKRMEDDRDRLVVIVAGYTKEMEDFINSNPGLQSRFNRYIHFTDYTAEELYDIFCLQMKKNEYTISEEASNRLKMILADALAHKEKDFGNARFVRNLFEKVIEHQANRLANEPNLTKELLAELREEDFNL